MFGKKNLKQVLFQVEKIPSEESIIDRLRIPSIHLKFNETPSEINTTSDGSTIYYQKKNVSFRFLQTNNEY